jgi:chromosome segregation ATPase
VTDKNNKNHRMKQILSWKKIPLLLIAVGVVVTVTVAQSNSGTQKYAANDTIPPKQKKVRDLDDALAEIDRSEIELQRALKEFDREKMEKEIREAMKTMEIDMAKMKVDIEKAMKEIDAEKINLDVQKALKEVESEKISKEIKESLAKVDMEKVKAEMENAKIEMQKAKEIDMSKIKAELEKIGPQVEKAMKEANVSIEKAREEITSYKNLVDALDRDGLLNKNENYKIEYKDKELTVNGKRLTSDATQKYNTYLSDKDHFTLEKNDDGLNIKK